MLLCAQLIYIILNYYWKLIYSTTRFLLWFNVSNFLHIIKYFSKTARPFKNSLHLKVNLDIYLPFFTGFIRKITQK